MSRGYRNCNPGNIRRSGVRYRGETDGQDPAFKSFASMAWGFRAMFTLLHTYRVRYGCRTLRAMIGRYAPPSENDTQAYVCAVSRWSGVPADEELNTLDGAVMRPVAAAMARVENGAAACDDDVAEGWRLFASDFGDGV